MKLPFVSRERFEELQKELRELKENHERILDQMMFVSTGMHAFARFDKKQTSVTEPSAGLTQAQVESESGISDAINHVGRRATAIRNYMEAKSVSGMAEAEQKALETLPTREVQAQINKALSLADERAMQA